MLNALPKSNMVRFKDGIGTVSINKQRFPVKGCQLYCLRDLHTIGATQALPEVMMRVHRNALTTYVKR